MIQKFITLSSGNDQLPEECKQSLMKDQKGGHPVRCVFINVQRTFLWKPEFINSNLTGPYLPVLCDSSDPAFQVCHCAHMWQQ